MTHARAIARPIRAKRLFDQRTPEADRGRGAEIWGEGGRYGWMGLRVCWLFALD